VTATPDAPPVQESAGPSDAELIAAVRGGDDAAFGVLWSRHEAAARRLARQITRPSEADDLVSESFYRVLRAIKSGGGPDAAFRPYLLSTMRRFNIDTGRSYHQRVVLTEEQTDLEVDHAASSAQVVEEAGEGVAAWAAWQSLPESSRTLLWHLVIEEETPAQIAPLLGTTPNGVASRAVRAKERLRQAFLSQHLAEADEEACRSARAKFGAYVRNALSARDRAAVDAHLRECERCRAALLEIEDTNSSLRGIIAPIVLGGALVAGKYLAAGHAAAGAVTGAGAVFAAKRAMRSAAKKATSTPGGVAAGVAAIAVVAGLAAAAINLGNHHGGTPAAAHTQKKSVSVTAPVAPGSSTATSVPKKTVPSKPTTSPTQPRTAPLGPTPSSPGAGTVPAPPPATSPTSPRTGTSTHLTPKPTPSTQPTKPSSTPPSSTPTPPPVGTETISVTSESSLGNMVTLIVPAGWQITAVIAPDGTDLGDTPTSNGRWFIAPGTFTVKVTGSSSTKSFLTVYTTNGSGSGEYPLN
jgi:RNA polymerase sigma factor (sigma-70 family)